MVITVGETSVSIPNSIADWVRESEDNKTEFYGMIDSMMYACKSFYKNRYKPNPYQEVYEEQVKEFMSLGNTREQADEMIRSIVVREMKKVNEEWDSNGLNTLLELFKR